jgi:hypothetical protein
MTSSVIEGGCLCRAVRYRVNGVPIVTSLCHCRTCQLAAGAPSVAWAVLRSRDFMFSAAQPARFRSSPAVTRTFCSRCGTSLTYQRDAEPDTIDVTTTPLRSTRRAAGGPGELQRLEQQRIFGQRPCTSIGVSP